MYSISGGFPMDDIQPESNDPQPQPNPVSYGEVLSPSSPPGSKSRRNWVIAIVAAIFVCCLCTGLCGLIFGRGIFTTVRETGDVSLVIDSFMRYMENKDIESAYNLFSVRSRSQTPVSDLEDLISGNNYVLFDSYQSLSITNVNISAAFNTNPDLPQGTVAKVEGIVYYSNGFQGSFNAVLEQEGDQWRLFGIQVNVPPNKFENADGNSFNPIECLIQQTTAIPTNPSS
jgi:hypothetical protein